MTSTLYQEEGYLKYQRHGKCFRWYRNGQLDWEENYHHGQLHGKDVGWREDGTLQYEHYYIRGRPVTREEWEQHNESTT